MGFELTAQSHSRAQDIRREVQSPKAEGTTVATLNLFDRMLATIRNAFARRPANRAGYKQAYARGSAAK